MEREKTASEIYYDMIDRCEKRTLKYLRKLILEKAYEERVKNKKIKIHTKVIKLLK